jgi:hypothetical protein
MAIYPVHNTFNLFLIGRIIPGDSIDHSSNHQVPNVSTEHDIRWVVDMYFCSDWKQVSTFTQQFTDWAVLYSLPAQSRGRQVETNQSHSFATQLWHLIVTQGLLYGLGFLCIYYPMLSMLNEWFHKRRGTAYGIM